MRKLKCEFKRNLSVEEYWKKVNEKASNEDTKARLLGCYTYKKNNITFSLVEFPDGKYKHLSVFYTNGFSKKEEGKILNRFFGGGMITKETAGFKKDVWNYYQSVGD